MMDNNSSLKRNHNEIINSYANHSILDGKWFREINDGWKGYSLSLEIDQILFHQKSSIQDILVFKSTSFGNVLVLDGIIQCTERDEFTYQEMITHLPMYTHPNPKKVLVIGGGDGGVVREVLKHSSVEEVVLAEIDQMVVDVSKIYLPSMAGCLTDSRVNIQIGDGITYVSDHPGEFDVIITDAPDPVGPATSLYERNFYSKLKSALTNDGIMCCQGQTTFLDLELVGSMARQCRDVFPNVGYATGNTPTYASGLMGYLLASVNPDVDLCQPVRHVTDTDVDRMKLRNYNSDLHRSAFVLPTYIRKFLKGIINT